MTIFGSTTTARRVRPLAVLVLLAVLAGTAWSIPSASPTTSKRRTQHSAKPNHHSTPAKRGSLPPTVVEHRTKLDTKAPYVVSIKRRGASPTNKQTVAWTIRFSERVTGVRKPSFTLGRAGLSGVSAILRISGSGRTRVVTASTGSRPRISGVPGWLRLTLAQRKGIHDAAGNTLRKRFGGPRYTIDKFTPAPVLVSIPEDPSPDATARFGWTEKEAGDTFRCSIEGGPFTVRCSSPYDYIVRTTDGRHRFAVEAIDRLGNVSSAASYSWLIEQGSIRAFTIDGDATGTLYPGAGPVAIALTLHNPDDTPIFVTGVAVSLRAGDFPAGCDSDRFHLVQAVIPSAGVVVPANGRVTFPAQGATAPTVQIAGDGNENACRNLRFHFEYTGSAHS